MLFLFVWVIVTVENWLKNFYLVRKPTKRIESMSRSKSTPDIYKVTVTRTTSKSLDEELMELCNLSGVILDPDVFKILLDLIKLNVSPTSLVSVLKKIAATKGYQSEAPSTTKLTSSSSSTSLGTSSIDPTPSLLTSGSGLGSTQNSSRERIPISSRLKEMRAHAALQS